MAFVACPVGGPVAGQAPGAEWSALVAPQVNRHLDEDDAPSLAGPGGAVTAGGGAYLTLRIGLIL